MARSKLRLGSLLNSTLASSVPVSYTHLDVYKRQTLSNTRILTIPLLCKGFQRTLCRISGGGLVNGLQVSRHFFHAVSYTHLDVYKRQALYLSIVTPFTTSTQSEQFGTLAVGVSSSVYLSEPNIESQPYDSFLINDNSGYFSVDNMASWRSDQTVAKWSVSNTAPVPEPETYAMFLAGLGLMGFVARRKKVA